MNIIFDSINMFSKVMKYTKGIVKESRLFTLQDLYKLPERLKERRPAVK